MCISDPANVHGVPIKRGIGYNFFAKKPTLTKAFWRNIPERLWASAILEGYSITLMTSDMSQLLLLFGRGLFGRGLLGCGGCGLRLGWCYVRHLPQQDIG